MNCQKIKHNALNSFIVTTVGAYSVFWTILGYNSYFGSGELLKNTGIQGHLLLIVSCILLGLIVASDRYVKEYKGTFENEIEKRNNEIAILKSEIEATENTTGDGAEILLDYVKNLEKKGDYSAAIRFGLALSRPLWLQDGHKIRIGIGEIVENAAVKLNNKIAQASVLIDDIGWTYVPLKRYSEAKKNIGHGLNIALTISNHYLAAKALRHLGGIAIVEKAATDEAIDFCNKALKEAEQINDLEDQKEMIAGINYGLSKIYWMKNELEKAEKYCLDAKEIYQNLGDTERFVMSFSQLGKIYEKKERLDVAKDVYRTGLSFAEESNIKVEIIRNRLGIARVLKKEGHEKDAMEHLRIAKELHKTTPITFEVGNMDMDLELLEGSEL
ncbi:MAG: hypothetical protein KKA10_13795 [Euryarchaeota archaeon]|nr:hypothetical protein [Euryarchaeota archaeon]MCG2736291.1 hypothetical protein [Candidatus Methanoperedenaceae archaeon]